MRWRHAAFFLSSAFGLAALSPGSARAEGVREVFVFVDPSVKCVQYDALMTSLRRDTPYEVHATGRTAPPPSAGDRRVRLELASDEGSITVRLEGDGLHVAEQLRAPRCDAATEVVAAFVTSALTPAPNVPVAPQEEARPIPAVPPPEPRDTIVAQRATLLADALATNGDHGGTAGTRRVLGIVVATSGLMLSFLGALSYSRSDPQQGTLGGGLIGAGLLYATSGVVVALHPDDAPPAYVAAPALLASGVLIGSSFWAIDDAPPPLAVAGIAGGYAGQAGLMLLSDVIRPPLTMRRTRSMRASIRTPEQRAALSPDGLRALEEEVANARAPWSPFVAVLPMVIGGSVALASTFDDDYSVNMRLYVGLQGLVMMTSAIAWAEALGDAPDRLYARKLETNGFEVGVLPVAGGSGISVTGRF